MLKTSKLQLNKPEGTDVVNIADLNANMDILDTEVTKLATTAVDGRMSKEDKVKLNALPSGADITQLSNSLTTHLAERATLEKLGHVKAETSADGTLVLNKTKVGLPNVEDKSSQTIRTETTTALRTEVVNSLPQTAEKGRIVFLDDAEPAFKGFNGGEWV